MNQDLMDFFSMPKKIQDGAYLTNLDQYADVGTHWIISFCNRSEIVYFDSFGVEYVPEKIKEFVGNKNIKADIFRVQGNISECLDSFALDSLILC